MAAYTGITASNAAVTNRYVASTNMIVGAYSLAQTTPPWTQGGALTTVTHTAVGAADTLGTIIVVGTDIAGNVKTDTIVPINGSTATGLISFKTITSITGAGWVINAGNDTVVIGVAAGTICSGTSGTLYAVIVNTTAATAVVLSDSTRTIATLKASIAEGHYIYGPGADFVGFLKVSSTGANDITVIHSYSNPSGV